MPWCFRCLADYRSPDGAWIRIRSGLIADFHTSFQSRLGSDLHRSVARVRQALEWLLPEPATRPDPDRPRFISIRGIGTPSLALTCAARETLHMGDLIETMLRQTIIALMTDDRKLVSDDRTHGQRR